MNRSKSRVSAMVVAILLAGMQGIASVFNRNITPVRLAPVAPARKKGFRTGIKGVKSSNNTEYGAVLKHHFENMRGRA